MQEEHRVVTLRRSLTDWSASRQGRWDRRSLRILNVRQRQIRNCMAAASRQHARNMPPGTRGLFHSLADRLANSMCSYVVHRSWGYYTYLSENDFARSSPWSAWRTEDIDLIAAFMAFLRGLTLRAEPSWRTSPDGGFTRLSFIVKLPRRRARQRRRQTSASKSA